MKRKRQPLPSPLKYHGGKSVLGPKLAALAPKQYTSFLDAYCGALNMMLALDGVEISEYANDLNGDLTNFWRVLRDEPQDMLRDLWFEPLSQAAFMQHTPLTAPVKRATQFFVRNRMSRQGLGKDYCTPTSRTRRGMNENVSAWLSSIEGLWELHERLQRVEIWQMPAIRAIERLDSEELFTYLDPPYLPETRETKSAYGDFEMSYDEHVELLDYLGTVKCKFMLSGYYSPLYDSYAIMNGWDRVDIEATLSSSSKSVKDTNTECVWRNY